MHRGQRERNVDLLVVLLYFTAQLTGISNAGDICSDEELTATFEVQSIYSPNFPNNYPNDVNCTTLITSPENTIIELLFDHFHLEFAKTTEPCNDSLSVRIRTVN
ncbi:hypothetical protein HOLleu_15737 [Holothuria leucospilota]|uniref:CUB domain-containing protein n=1 Tax=Holothuria leucospilota TaxID=206669 RepID=A0A9Q1C347_HOLLE|nr:hypothetical protein HOLleu_15737 [Holothuria leucospilota]